MKYTMTLQMYPGEWHEIFNFNATDHIDANKKADKWAHYHSFQHSDVKPVPCTNEWTDTNDEWVRWLSRFAFSTV